MTATFAPEAFYDKYREELMALINARAHHRTPAKNRSAKRGASSNVVNLMDVLQASLAETKHHRTDTTSGGGEERTLAAKAHRKLPPTHRAEVPRLADGARRR